MSESDIALLTEYQDEYKDFYCGARATEIPVDLYTKVVTIRMSDRWGYVDPAILARQLHRFKLLTQDEVYDFTRDAVQIGDRRYKLLYEVLPRKASHHLLLFLFYLSLKKSEVNPDLPLDVQRLALKECRLDRPVLIPGVDSMKTLQGMTEHLVGKIVPEEAAKDFAKCLGLFGGDLDHLTEMSLSGITEVWLNKDPNQCTPELLVEALICTRGLGMYASKLAYPIDRQCVEKVLLEIGDHWREVVTFFGYTRADLEGILKGTMRQQIASFVTQVFQMPHCGQLSDEILSKALCVAQIECPKISQFPNWNVPEGYDLPTLELYEDEPLVQSKPSAATPSHDIKLPDVAQHVQMQFQQFRRWWGQVAIACPFPVDPPLPLIAVSPYDVDRRNAEQFQAARHASWASYRGEQMSRVSCPDQEGTYGMFTHQGASPCEAFVPDPVPPNDTEEEETVKNKQCESAVTPLEHDGKLSCPRVPATDEIIQACKSGDVGYISNLLEAQTSFDFQTEDDGSYPLHVAVMSGNEELLQMLAASYDSVGNIDVRRDDLRTPLMLACMNKQAPFVHILLERGADPALLDKMGMTCLHYKESLEVPEIVQILVERFPSVDIPSQNPNLTPLICACLLGEVQSALILLGKGANPDGISEAESTPLCAAVNSGDLELVQKLLEKGATPNLQDKDGRSPLLEACKKGNVDMVSKLINADADVNLPDKDKNTPVLVAVHNNNTELLQLLVACQANVNHTKVVLFADGEAEITPLILAAGQGKLEMVEILVKSEATVNYVSPRALSPLTWAVVGGNVKVVEFLLKLNEIGTELEVMAAPIMTASRTQRDDILDSLLNPLGGIEKVIHQASEAGLQEFLQVLQQVERRRSLDACFEVSQDEHDTVMAHVTSTLAEFMTLAIETAQRKQENAQDYISNEALKQKLPHVAIFFEQYFFSPTMVDLVGCFIQTLPCLSPAQFLFEDENLFDGETFKQVLSEKRSHVMENLVSALLSFPGISQLGLNAKAAIQMCMGFRFYDEVQHWKLFLPLEYASDEGASGTTEEQAHQPTEDVDRDKCSPMLVNGCVSEAETWQERASEVQRQHEGVTQEQRTKGSATEEQRLLESAAEEQRLVDSAAEDQGMHASATEDQGMQASATQEQRLMDSATEEQRLMDSATEEQGLQEVATEEQRLPDSTNEDQMLQVSVTEGQRLPDSATEEQGLRECATEDQRLLESATEEEGLRESATEEQRLQESAIKEQHKHESTVRGRKQKQSLEAVGTHGRPSRIPIPTRLLNSSHLPLRYPPSKHFNTTGNGRQPFPQYSPHEVHHKGGQTDGAACQTGQDRSRLQGIARRSGRARNCQASAPNVCKPPQRSKSLPDEKSRPLTPAAPSLSGAGPHTTTTTTTTTTKQVLPVPASAPKPKCRKYRDGVFSQAPVKNIPIEESRRLFRDFSRRIFIWKTLARYLNLHDREIDRISRDYEYEIEQCYQMLCTWKKQYGNRATYSRFAEGLQNIRQEDLIKDLLKYQDRTEHPCEQRSSAINRFRTPDKVYRVKLSQPGCVLDLVLEMGAYLKECQRVGYKRAEISVKLE